MNADRLRLIGAITFLVGLFLTLVATFWFGMIYQKGELSGLNILWPIVSIICPLIASVFIYFKNGLWKEHTVGTGTEWYYSKRDIDRLVEERVEERRKDLYRRDFSDRRGYACAREMPVNFGTPVDSEHIPVFRGFSGFDHRVIFCDWLVSASASEDHNKAEFDYFLKHISILCESIKRLHDLSKPGNTAQAQRDMQCTSATLTNACV